MRHSVFQCLLKMVVAILVLHTTHGFAQTSNESTPVNASSEQSSEKSTHTTPSEKIDALLALAKPDEIEWLDTPNGKVLGLLKEGEQKKNKGAVLILHAPELSQRWPAALDNLRRNLPLYGWTTLAVSLPEKDITVASSSEQQSAVSDPVVASTETSASNPRIPRAQIIAERVEAATNTLRDKGNSSIVIVVDNSSAPDALAAPLSKIPPRATPKELKNGPLHAVIIMNLQQQEPLTKAQLVSIFSAPALPVMEVFFSPDDSSQIDLRRAHRAEAMRHKLDNYQQVILPPDASVTVNNNKNFWLEKARGFIERKSEGLSKATEDK